MLCWKCQSSSCSLCRPQSIPSYKGYQTLNSPYSRTDSKIELVFTKALYTRITIKNQIEIHIIWKCFKNFNWQIAVKCFETKQDILFVKLISIKIYSSWIFIRCVVCHHFGNAELKTNSFINLNMQRFQLQLLNMTTDKNREESRIGPLCIIVFPYIISSSDAVDMCLLPIVTVNNTDLRVL